MAEKYGLVTAEHALLRSEPEAEDNRNVSGVEDEILSGWAVRFLEEENGKQYQKIETHYGYTGYVNREELCVITEEELRQRQNPERFYRIQLGEVDLLDQPKVQGLPMELLLKNSIVELLEREAEEGWSKVRSASGKEGYIHTQNLKVRKDTDAYLLLKTEEERAGFFLNWKERMAKQVSGEVDMLKEEQLREQLERSAREFAGTQYRWGGKSSQGIDCSGLLFMTYLDQGILIYRDAQIVDTYPVKQIPKEQLKKGDLIFFPGHVAMYLGDGRYIHATGYVKTPYVTINSLNPEDPLYRADLAEKITECGSIFV